MTTNIQKTPELPPEESTQEEEKVVVESKHESNKRQLETSSSDDVIEPPKKKQAVESTTGAIVAVPVQPVTKPDNKTKPVVRQGLTLEDLDVDQVNIGVKAVKIDSTNGGKNTKVDAKKLVDPDLKITLSYGKDRRRLVFKKERCWSNFDFQYNKNKWEDVMFHLRINDKEKAALTALNTKINIVIQKLFLQPKIKYESIYDEKPVPEEKFDATDPNQKKFYPALIHILVPTLYSDKNAKQIKELDYEKCTFNDMSTPTKKCTLDDLDRKLPHDILYELEFVRVRKVGEKKRNFARVQLQMVQWRKHARKPRDSYGLDDDTSVGSSMTYVDKSQQSSLENPEKGI